MFAVQVLAQSQVDGGGAAAAIAGGIMMLIWLAVIIALIASMWKIFTKAGQPGWAALVPIYNAVVLLQIVGRPIWWLILFMIPLVNLGVSIVLALDVAKSYGKGTGFAVGLILLPFVFYPMLGFGNAQYLGPQQAF